MKLLKLLTLIFLIQFKAHALIEVDITRGNLSPLPVAVSSLFSEEKTLNEFEKKLNINDIGLEI